MIMMEDTPFGTFNDATLEAGGGHAGLERLTTMMQSYGSCSHIGSREESYQVTNVPCL